jgi:hypothetical protein
MKLTLPKVGTWSLSGLLKTQSLIAGVTTPRIRVFVFYTIGKVLKCRCPKWPYMSHLDICSTSYGRKKGRDSNCQTQPLKVGNRPDPSMCKWSEKHHWKALEESYKFSLEFIPIGGLSWELWALKVSRVQTGTISRLLLGSPGTKNHSDVGPMGERREYYMGEDGGFPWVRAVLSQVNPCCPWLVPTLRLIENED